eukprot:3946478-Amphidinium_carterae.1
MSTADDESASPGTNDAMMFDVGNLLHDGSTIVRAGPDIRQVEMLFNMPLTRLNNAIMLSAQSQGLQKLRGRHRTKASNDASRDLSSDPECSEL